jgi:hypothetical protein
MLSPEQVDQFVEDGFVRIDRAFPRDIADAGLAALWRATGCDPHNPSTWTHPVIRLGRVKAVAAERRFYSSDAINTIERIQREKRPGAALRAARMPGNTPFLSYGFLPACGDDYANNHNTGHDVADPRADAKCVQHRQQEDEE